MSRSNMAMAAGQFSTKIRSCCATEPSTAFNCGSVFTQQFPLTIRSSPPENDGSAKLCQGEIPPPCNLELERLVQWILWNRPAGSLDYLLTAGTIPCDSGCAGDKRASAG